MLSKSMRGEYLNDNVAWRNNNLTLRGVGGGRAYLHDTVLTR